MRSVPSWTQAFLTWQLFTFLQLRRHYRETWCRQTRQCAIGSSVPSNYRSIPLFQVLGLQLEVTAGGWRTQPWQKRPECTFRFVSSDESFSGRASCGAFKSPLPHLRPVPSLTRSAWFEQHLSWEVDNVLSTWRTSVTLSQRFCLMFFFNFFVKFVTEIALLSVRYEHYSP